VVDVSPKQSKQMETGDGDGDDDCMGNYDYIDDCTFFYKYIFKDVNT